ncbi:MAG: LysR family transcriptional regulator [Hyphomonadaceae bacterium]|nr:LysR family transcriptional regulator [Hyphomonadaceae bacterium]
MDWDDLRFVLAVARSGSALAAARDLGVNQTTVIRRVAQLEEALGSDLFERLQKGYAPTPLGQCVAKTAERIEAEVAALESAIAAAQRNLTGAVRLTTSEMLANRLVVPCLPAFRKLHPGVRIELMAQDRRLDIARGEADIALRAGYSPEGAGIVARKMPLTTWSVYCSKDYAAENGMPRTRAEIADHAVVGMEGPMALLPGPRWIDTAAPNADVRVRSNSLTNLVLNLRAGLGVATLPCFVADAEPDLVRCMPAPPELDAEIWLIVNEELKSASHIRAFADFLAQHINGMRAELGAGR